MNIVYEYGNDTSVTKILSYSQSAKTDNRAVEPPFFYNGCAECVYVPAVTITANDNSFAFSSSHSYNECGGSSSKASCKGRCNDLSAGHTHKEVGIGYGKNTTSSQKVKLTCVEGFSSQNNSTEKPYTKSATVFCATSTSKDGRDLSFFGGYQEEPKLSCVSHPKKATIFPGLFAVPAKYTSVELTYTDPYGLNEEGFGDCNTPRTLTSYASYYASSKVECSNGIPNAWPMHLVNYQCESFHCFTGGGKYINYSADISDFKSTSAALISSQTLAINSGTTKIGSNDTYKYTNEEVTAMGLSKAEANGKATFLYLASDKVYSYDFEVWTGQLKIGSDVITLFESNTAECTRIVEYNTNYDPCKGSYTPETTTVTDYAGITLSIKESFYSETNLGNFQALALSETIRTLELRYYDFDYSVAISDNYNDEKQNQEEITCMSHESRKVGYMDYPGVFPCSSFLEEGGDDDGACMCQDLIGNSTYEAPKWPQATQSNVEYYTECVNFGCGGQTSSCKSESSYSIFTSQGCQATYVSGCEEVKAPMVMGPAGYMMVAKVQMYSVEVDDVPIKQNWNNGSTCNVSMAMGYGQSITRRTYQNTESKAFGAGNNVYAKAIYPFGILRTNDDSANPYIWNTTFSISDKDKVIESSHIIQAFHPINNGLAYSPPASGIRLTEAGKTTFMIFSSTSTDKNSYLVSSSSSKGVWEKASWSGFGVFRGPFKSGTFDVAFSGNKSNTQAFLGNSFVYSPGQKQTCVCNGGLNIISSRAESSGKLSTTYRTQAFSTSFDSTYKGAFIVRHIPFTTCRTSPDYKHNGFAIPESIRLLEFFEEETSCDACEIDNIATHRVVPQLATITDTSTYFIQGDTSKLYINNSISYFWTSPEKRKAYGTGHGKCTEAP